MDPTMTLMVLRAAVRKFDEATERATSATLALVHEDTREADKAREEVAQAESDALDAGQAIRDAAGALDEWMTGGGFLPLGWGWKQTGTD